jgi:hypothetical protein
MLLLSYASCRDFCLWICSKTIWLYILFLTNLEDEISCKGVGFVKPKIGRRNNNNNDEINK